MIFKRHKIQMFFTITFLLIGLGMFSSLTVTPQAAVSWFYDIANHGVSQESISSKPLANSKSCTKLRAPDPYRKQCGGKVNIAPANARSRTHDDNERLALNLGDAQGFPFFAHLPWHFRELGRWYNKIRGPTNNARAVFWAIYAIAPRMRN